MSDPEVIYESYGNKLIGAGATGGGSSEQVQADWEQSDTTAPDYIKNKPSLSTVATSGDYEDLSNKPTTLSGYGITDAYTKTQADNKLNSRVEILIPPTITNHASYKNAGGNRGKNITEYFTDGTLWKRIAGTDGFEPFEDLYLWDYIELDTAITASGSGTTGTKKIHIGEFNALNNYQLNAKTGMKDYFNHLLMVPDTHFGTAQMNRRNTTEDGYAGSNMHTAILGQYNTANSISAQLYAQLGSHLKKTKELLTKSINASGYNRFGANSGCSSNWDWYDCYSVLLSEVETYGSIVWSSAGYDTGNAKKQIAAFTNDEMTMFPQGIHFWLKDVATSANFCGAGGNNGHADCGNASYSRFVRPRFIIA